MNSKLLKNIFVCWLLILIFASQPRLYSFSFRIYPSTAEKKEKSHFFYGLYFTSTITPILCSRRWDYYDFSVYLLEQKLAVYAFDIFISVYIERREIYIDIKIVGLQAGIE